jgi:membrane protease YdiL (CAAX protease family)
MFRIAPTTSGSSPPRIAYALVATLMVAAWNYIVLSMHGWKQVHDVLIDWGLAGGNALRLVNLMGNWLYYLGWLLTATALYLASGRPFLELFPFRAVTPIRMAGLLAAGLLVGPLGLAMSELLAPVVGLQDTPPPELRRYGMLPVRLIVIFASALLAALAEEALCRGIIYRALLNSAGTTAAIVGSSAAFVVLHLDPARAVYLVLPALLLGCARAWTGSLWPGFVIHAFHNARSDIYVNVPELAELLAGIQ